LGVIVVGGAADSIRDIALAVAADSTGAPDGLKGAGVKGTPFESIVGSAG